MKKLILAVLCLLTSSQALAVGIPGRVVTGTVFKIEVLDPCGKEAVGRPDEVYLNLNGSILTAVGRGDVNFFDPQVYLGLVPAGFPLETRDDTHCHFIINNGVMTEL